MRARVLIMTTPPIYDDARCAVPSFRHAGHAVQDKRGGAVFLIVTPSQQPAAHLQRRVIALSSIVICHRLSRKAERALPNPVRNLYRWSVVTWWSEPSCLLAGTKQLHGRRVGVGVEVGARTGAGATPNCVHTHKKKVGCCNQKLVATTKRFS